MYTDYKELKNEVRKLITEKDIYYLKRAVILAENALNQGEEPFGSLLVSHNDAVLFEDYNRVSDGDHTRHPEFEIARWAANHMIPKNRKLATVYTTGEHCPMCAAAHGWVGLGRIVYASSSQQLDEWRQVYQWPESPVESLPIKAIIRHANVDGPVELLSEEIKQLHIQSHQRKFK